MKKLVCILILFCFVSPAWAVIEPPRWSDYCPREYLNAEYQKDTTLPKWVGVLCICSIVGMPIAAYDLNKYQNIQTNNYWVDRRNKFEKRIEACKNITDPNELMYQYLTIRQIQSDNDSELRMDALQRQQQYLANQQRVQYMSTQSNINNMQMQNRINTINNNLLKQY